MSLWKEDFKCLIRKHVGSLGGASGTESACQCRRYKRRRFDPWIRKVPWSRKWQPAPIYLPGKFHGQRSLAGYSPQARRELDITERLSSNKIYESLNHCRQSTTVRLESNTNGLTPVLFFFLCFFFLFFSFFICSEFCHTLK